MVNVNKEEKLTNLEYSIAGGTTGVITRCLFQPLDVIKIRFQLQTDPISNKSKGSKYRSVHQAVMLIIKEEKLFGLWKGHIPAQFLSVIYGAVQFSSYEFLNETLNFSKYSWGEPVKHFGTGAVSGVLATVSSYPLDIIRTRLIAQGQKKEYSGTINASVKIFKSEGIFGLQRGLLPAVIQVLPSAGLIFGFNNLFNLMWLKFIQMDVNNYKNRNTKQISRIGSLVCGSLAGICSKTVIYPLDVIKKRLQVVGFKTENAYFKQVSYNGICDCLLKMLRNEGVFSLFKGLYPSLIKAGAVNASYFFFYNEVCNAFYRMNTVLK